MAIVAFHFSGIYKEKLLSNKKCASVMTGNNTYQIDSDVLVYLSDTDNLFDKEAKEKRIGSATIVTTRICILSNLTDDEAKRCGYDSKDELIREMKQWFPQLRDKDQVTYVEFRLKLSKQDLET